MITVVLGTKASASTWVFNVVRSLVAIKDPGALSLFAELGEEVISNVPPLCRDLVVKAHSLDRAFLRLIEMTGAKVICTDRDPADSLASQVQRFGLPLTLTVPDLTKTYASFAMLEPSIEVLHLRYEDGFASEPATVQRLADFVAAPVSKEQCRQIFERFHVDRMRQEIDTWVCSQADLRQVPADTIWDEATQWHPNHVGDAAVGKGEETLSAGALLAVRGACPRLTSLAEWRDWDVRWPAHLFRYNDERSPSPVERISLSCQDAGILFGPYCFLPSGQWRARLLIRMIGDGAVFFRADIFVTSRKRGMLTMKTCCATSNMSDDVVIEFTHLDHFEPIEVRLQSYGDSVGAFEFRGVDLRYLGPLEHSMPLRSRPVTASLTISSPSNEAAALEP